MLLLLLPLLLSSCSLLDRVERLNARTYLRRSLADLSHEDRPAELTDYPLLLYPLRSLPAGEGEKLFRTADALGDTLLLERIGLRTGHPEVALESQDKRQAMMAAALLGAPIGHDFCSVSLSDLMTPWAVIERRIVAAAEGDFVTAVFNPRSRQRYWQLTRLVELFLLHRRGDTPVGIVYQAGRPEQRVQVTTLDHLDEAEVDMLTMILIGNSQSYISGDHIVTPRGYYREEEREGSVGAKIMSESFHTILPLLKHADRYDTGHLWALLHAIHTTADFEMEELLHTDPEAVRRIYERISSGEVDTIVTDVTMVVSGIRKKALERYGLEAKCYLHDPRIAEMTAGGKLTRTQAGIRLAVKDHPRALFAFGNAPTALMELADLIHQGKAEPAGIIAAPVGFVHVCESKHMIKPFREIPKLIIEGRKGGSNLAATLCNAILSYDDAAAIRPGRDV